MQQQATNVNTKPSVSSTAPANWLTRMKRSTYFFPLAGLVAVCLVMIVTTDNFFSADNFLNIARQVSINAIIAIGMTCAILSGGIDLSVGAVMALAGTLMAGSMIAGVPPYAAILIGLGVGLAFGLFNGALVAFAGLPPFIVTLGTYTALRGAAYLLADGTTVINSNISFEWIGNNYLGPVPWLVVIALALTFLFFRSGFDFGYVIPRRLARLAAQGGNNHGQHPQRVCGGSSGLGRGKRPFAGQRGGEPDALPARHPAAAGSGVVPLCKAGGADLIHY